MKCLSQCSVRRCMELAMLLIEGYPLQAVSTKVWQHSRSIRWVYTGISHGLTVRSGYNSSRCSCQKPSLFTFAYSCQGSQVLSACYTKLRHACLSYCAVQEARIDVCKHRRAGSTNLDVRLETSLNAYGALRSLLRTDCDHLYRPQSLGMLLSLDAVL